MRIRVKIENQSYEVNIGDLNSRPIIATVDGQTVEVWPEEIQRVASPTPAPTPVVATTLTAPTAAVSTPTPVPAPVISSGEAKIGAITAPIPGVIVGINVKEGDKIAKGQELCVLEAMKMKNSIKSSRDGIIGAVKVKVGDHIQQRQVLIEFKD